MEEARTPLKVVVVQPYAGMGGSERWLLRLLDAADDLEPSVVLLADGPLRLALQERGVPVRMRPVGRSPLDLVRPIGWLARVLRRERPDVVLGNVLKGQLVAGPAARLAGIPSVWAKHDHGYDRWLARPVARQADAVVAAVEELAAPTRRPDAVIIPPPRPDVAPARREAARDWLRGFGVPVGDEPLVLMAGRLVPFKGVDDLLRALAYEGGKPWRLVVAGADDPAAPGETARLAGLARDLGVDERVHFVGHVPDAAHWMAAFDAVAVLTKPTGNRRAPDREGFGTSAFEAMIAGVPVIAVRGGAVVRRLAGRAGIGVPPGDPEAVADALAQLADPVARADAGAAARELVADHPDATTCADMLVEVLRSAQPAVGGAHGA